MSFVFDFNSVVYAKPFPELYNFQISELKNTTRTSNCIAIRHNNSIYSYLYLFSVHVFLYVDPRGTKYYR
jgi:hypothetical protein